MSVFNFFKKKEKLLVGIITWNFSYGYRNTWTLESIGKNITGIVTVKFYEDSKGKRSLIVETSDFFRDHLLNKLPDYNLIKDWKQGCYNHWSIPSYQEVKDNKAIFKEDYN